MLSIICYFSITINSVHFAAPLIFFLVVELFSGTLLGTTVGIIAWLSIFGLIWTMYTEKPKRDKILIPIISVILSTPIAIYLYDQYDNDILSQKNFLLPFSLFLILTAGHVTLTLRQKDH